MSKDGFILNDTQYNIDQTHHSHGCEFSVSVSQDSLYTFVKQESAHPRPFQWIGYSYQSGNGVQTEVKFDIYFFKKVPEIGKGFSLKVHQYEYHYDSWLQQCVPDRWSSINLTVSTKKQTKQLFCWIADNYLSELKFSIRNIFITQSPQKIHFLSFVSEGPPHDNANDLRGCRDILSCHIAPHVDSIIFHSPRTLADRPELIKQFPIIAEHNPGTNNIGFLRWKPYIILKELQKVKNSDIVYYRDVNVIKYPNVLVDLHKTPHLLQYVLNDTDLFVPTERYPHLKFKHNVKIEVIKELMPNYDSLVLEHPLYNASIIICRKTPRVITFMIEWLHLCMNDERISPVYDSAIKHPDFKHNTQEQAILNMLLLRHKTIPRFSFNERLFTLEAIKKVPRVALLLCGEMRNFDHPILLQNNMCNLINLHNCDIFVSTWRHRGYSFNHGNTNKKSYADNSIIAESVINVYGKERVKALSIEDFTHWKQNILDADSRDILDTGFYNGHNLCPATCVPQLYKIWDANRLKTEYELKNGFTYDVVIRFRPDVCFIYPIPLKNILELPDNTIIHMNPPKIFYPNRIYDIFFFGRSSSMNNVTNSWQRIHELIRHPFDNGLSPVDCCRILYIMANIVCGYKVIEIPHCLGDIYRDENFKLYTQNINQWH